LWDARGSGQAHKELHREIFEGIPEEVLRFGLISSIVLCGTGRIFLLKNRSSARLAGLRDLPHSTMLEINEVPFRQGECLGLRSFLVDFWWVV